MSDKVAVVTGGGTGIGAATGMALAEAGFKVVVCGRRAEPLREVEQRIQQAGGACLVHAADVGDHRALEGLVQDAMKHFGRIDVWVNNAAIAAVAGLGEIDFSEINGMLRINATGLTYACKTVWPIMQAQGGGTIINISSAASFDPFPGLEVYGATKAYVNALTKGLAAEGKKHNIRVFAVAPGAVETAMLRSGFPDIPAAACLAPADIAAVVVALTRGAFAHSTGETIRVQR
ncbi:MAG TPA: SDR family oxidoreductase [Phycisphaerae bacterium]|nr:SDR family oxidoreductase [Phycisphaerae bacterium]